MNPHVLISLAVVTVALAGCMSSDDAIRQEGSSTLLPLANVWAREVAQLDHPLDVIVDGGGSGHGASGICNGQLDIGDMSRGMKGFKEWTAAGRPASGTFGSEIDICLQHGIVPLQWKVALDALTVIVPKSNTFATDLTVDQLASIFGDASITKWNQVDPSFPAQDIGLCFPGPGHGTHGYFLEEVLEKKGFEAFRTEKDVANGATYLQTNGEYDEITNCVKNSQYAIGFYGYSYFDQNRNSLTGVKVDGVEPSIANVIDGSYTPLGRYLYMYTASDLPEKLVHYFEYALTGGQQEALMTSAGFIALDAAAVAEMQAQLTAHS